MNVYTHRILFLVSSLTATTSRGIRRQSTTGHRERERQSDRETDTERETERVIVVGLEHEHTQVSPGGEDS